METDTYIMWSEWVKGFYVRTTQKGYIRTRKAQS